METKEQALAAIQEIMKQNGLTQEDIISALNIAPPAEEKLEYEILYADGTHSWFPLVGKTPWGVIIFGCAIQLKEIADKMNYNKAQNFCSKTIFKGKKCHSGSKFFWKKIINLNNEELEKLNTFIASINGQPLKGEYWTTGKCNTNDAFIAFLYKAQQGLSSANRHGKFKARRVIEIAELE